MIEENGCALCGLPLRRSTVAIQVSEGEALSFCCIGCKQVYSILMEAADAPDPTHFKETELFKHCLRIGIIPSLDSTSSEPFPPDADPSSEIEEVPDISKADPSAALPQADTLRLNLHVARMWCPACAWIIEEALRRDPGIHRAECSFSTDRLLCEYNPIRTAPDEIIKAINGLGYAAAEPGHPEEWRNRLFGFIRFGVSAFLTMNVMMLSFALYSGFFTDLGADSIRKLSWPIFIMATVVLFYGGKEIYKRAFAGLKNAGFSMETLITIGAFSAYLYSTWNLLAGSIHLYYDTVSMLITLVLLGKAIEGKAKAGVREDLEAFFSLQPSKVRLVTRDSPRGRYVAAEQLEIGDRFRVGADEVAAADGKILSGEALIDESSLTGEPKPVRRTAGGKIRSGTTVIQGEVEAQALAVGEDATLGQMIRIMAAALSSKSRLEGKTDRVLQWFVPAIILIAAGTGVGGYFLGLSPDAALTRAVTVLVISCPCALGVAIPLTRVAGIAVAGKKGILVRDFAAFEAAEKLDVIVFDKTGTLTRGQWRLIDIRTADSFSPEDVLSIGAALEAESDHMAAVEIRRAAQEKEISPAFVTEICPHETGVEGIWKGKKVFIGAPDSEEIPGHMQGDSREIRSVVTLQAEGSTAAVFSFGDGIREGAAEAVCALSDRGYRIALISGDGAWTTNAVARRLDLREAHGSMLPAQKMAFIEALQKKNLRAAMIGDGINDAPALVQSDLAAAVHSGSHLGKEAADITLMRGDPRQVIDFLDLAARVNRKVSQNLTFTFFYNLISIPIAMSGLLSPLVAVCAMLLSSLSVIGNTLLLTRASRRYTDFQSDDFKAMDSSFFKQ